MEKRLKGLRILVVEDSRLLIGAIKRLLQGEGAEVTTLHTLDSVLPDVSNMKQHWDVVLMDWCLNASVVQELYNHKIPVVVHTGSPEKVTVTAWPVLRKPADLSDIVRELKNMTELVDAGTSRS